MTIAQALAEATTRLTPTSDSPALDAEILLAYALNSHSTSDTAPRIDRAFLAGHAHDELTPAAHTYFTTLIERRAAHTPVAYLTGHKEFYGLDLKVTQDTLIPRPETELLVEQALHYIQEQTNKNPSAHIHIADVGTGSGCIAIAIATHLPRTQQSTVHIDALDQSAAALAVAQLNITEHRLNHLITTAQSDLLSALPYPQLPNLICANLPYVSSQEYNKLAPDLTHEPRSALVSEGDPDGLAHYARLFDQVTSRLANANSLTQPVIILCEISPQQHTASITKASARFPHARIVAHTDLAGLRRCLEITLQPK